jgi:hypothetical protein
MARSDRLDPDDYTSVASGLAPGATERVNHDECGDTRGRLYITRKEGGDDGIILAYCHNCGLGGGSRLGRRARSDARAVPKSVVGRPANDPFSLPSGTTFELGEFSPEALSWLRSYDLDRELPGPWVGYDPFMNRIVLPVWNGEGLQAYQWRSFDPTWTGPKYVSRFRKQPEADVPQPLEVPGAPYPSVLVVTEDTLSAVKVALAGYTGLPMWTAPRNCGKLLGLSRLYSNVVIWYDNDNPEVVLNAVKFARRLRAFNPRVEIILDKSDPKCYTIEEIQYTITKEII